MVKIEDYERGCQLVWFMIWYDMVITISCSQQSRHMTLIPHTASGTDLEKAYGHISGDILQGLLWKYGDYGAILRNIFSD